MYLCNLCKVSSYKQEKNLKRHQKTCQDKVQKHYEHKIKCPLCEFVVSRHKFLRNHITEDHNIPFLEEIEKHFENSDDFEKWKKEIEKDGICEYVAKSRITLKDGRIRSFYQCHRSGFFVSKSLGKKKMKSLGSNKIEASCPSMMVVTKEIIESEGDGSKLEKVLVLFYPIHIGHSCNFGRCRLTEEDRAMIAGKLKEGVSMETVLDQIRDNVSDIYDPKTLITKNELLNIKRDFGVREGLEGRQHSSDNISIQLWLKKMQMLDAEENPVLHFNNDDENFVLIIATRFQLEMLKTFGKAKLCIDSTHGTNSYDYQLTSLVVVDEFHNGYPTAYCISNKKDTVTWRIFFEEIKKKIGVIHADIFMTDDDPTYYNAWKAVMAPVQHRLLCSWHVDQNWRKNIHSKIKATHHEKAMVYKALKVVQYEPNEAEFKLLLEGIIEDFESNEETEEFGKYFRSNYANRPETWAYCYRLGCGINTNMYLESLHKCFKYFYLKAKKNKRLDKCLDALLKLTRDKMFERLIKKVKCKKTAKEERIQRSHMNSKEIASSVVRIECDLWEVPSAKDTEVCYEVRKINEECSENCAESCVQCNTCIHIFNCNCSDYIVHGNVCKHIHAVCRTIQPENIIDKSQVMQKLSENEMTLLTDCIVNSENGADADMTTKLHKNLINKEEVLSGFIRTGAYTDEQLKTLHKKLDNILQYVQKIQVKHRLDDKSNEENEPANKKICPQIRLGHKKKPRKKAADAAQSFVFPTSGMRFYLKESIKNTNVEVPALSDGADHLYLS